MLELGAGHTTDNGPKPADGDELRAYVQIDLIGAAYLGADDRPRLAVGMRGGVGHPMP